VLAWPTFLLATLMSSGTKQFSLLVSTLELFYVSDAYLCR
jgi:hypothetical protein